MQIGRILDPTARCRLHMLMRLIFSLDVRYHQRNRYLHLVELQCAGSPIQRGSSPKNGFITASCDLPVQK